MASLANLWLFRYKLHHLLFWLAYHFIWSLFYKGNAGHAIGYLQTAPGLISFMAFVVFQAAGVYFCLYFLLPRYLEKGRYAAFLAWMMLTVLVMGLLIYASYFLGAYIVGQPVENLYGLEGKAPITLFKVSAFPASLSSMTLGLSIKLGKNWLESQQRKRELEKEKLETELKYLKAQINPHFLFNTINSIFVLIRKDPELASQSLSQFSDLLRYQLYQCNEATILLAAECDYLENYIRLERLRHEPEQPRISFQKTMGEGNYYIAPFTLMPFVENAFKHFDRQNPGEIDIRLQVNGSRQLRFSVENSAANTPAKQTSLEEADAGIGLKNVKRRLMLQYPGKHELTTAREKGRFKINLQMELSSGEAK